MFWKCSRCAFEVFHLVTFSQSFNQLRESSQIHKEFTVFSPYFHQPTNVSPTCQIFANSQAFKQLANISGIHLLRHFTNLPNFRKLTHLPNGPEFAIFHIFHQLVTNFAHFRKSTNILPMAQFLVVLHFFTQLHNFHKFTHFWLTCKNSGVRKCLQSFHSRAELSRIHTRFLTNLPNNSGGRHFSNTFSPTRQPFTRSKFLGCHHFFTIFAQTRHLFTIFSPTKASKAANAGDVADARARWWLRDGARWPRRKTRALQPGARAQVCLGATLRLASCVLKTSDAGDVDAAGDAGRA